ncbi:MAG: murein L,D-transpeptidase catalytic domain family protein [Chitinophagaceae bacterium]
MKSLSKFFIAGALAGIFLFVHKTGTTPKPAAKEASVTTITKAPSNVAVIATTDNKVAPAQATVVLNKTNTQKQAAALQASIPSLRNNALKNIDVAKRTNSMSSKVIKAHVKALMEAIEESQLPEIVAFEKPNRPQEVEGIAPERTGGYAYEAKQSEKNNTPFSSLRQPDKGAESYSYMSVYDETEKMKDYAVNNGCNTEYALMVNLGMKSGKKRFFVIDLASNTIVKSGVVSEGNSEGAEKKYSNEIGSTASSLGAYKIGKRVKNDAGFGYRLVGLQESNNNAVKRSMMLQATEDVPYDEINFPVLKTDGSLSLSNRFLTEISPLIDESSKPMLLWVYDPNADNQALYSAVQKKH